MANELISRQTAESALDEIIKTYIAEKSYTGNFAAGVACDIRDNVIAELPSVNAVVLPCKVGDTVWFIPKYNGKALGIIREDKVQMIGVTSRGFHLKLRGNHEHNKMHMLGKTVFLTREEAEKALEGREDNG